MMSLVHSLETLFLVHPLWLGGILFALSWVRPQPLVGAIDHGNRDRPLLVWAACGAAAVLGVALAIETLDVIPSIRFLQLFEPSAGWWLRSAAPLMTAVVMFAAAVILRSARAEPAAARVIGPRRDWYAFGSAPAIWIGAIASLQFSATSVWHGATPIEPRPLPDLMSGELVSPNGNGAPASAFGWASHAPALAAVALLICGTVWALSVNANRALPGPGDESSRRLVRRQAARLLSWTALGGLLVTVGVAWTNAWAPSGWATPVTSHDGTIGQFVGSDFWGATQVLRYLGGAALATGTALLARLGVDSLRAHRALRRRYRAEGPDPAAVLGGVEEGR